MEVASAFGEAFNNVVQHGYRGSAEGLIQIDVRISSGHIDIDISDWGVAFDPKAVPLPDLDRLPESGLGLFIMQSFMDISYRPVSRISSRCPNRCEARARTGGAGSQLGSSRSQEDGR